MQDLHEASSTRASAAAQANQLNPQVTGGIEQVSAFGYFPPAPQWFEMDKVAHAFIIICRSYLTRKVSASSAIQKRRDAGNGISMRYVI
jgi:hypothetical protein